MNTTGYFQIKYRSELLVTYKTRSVNLPNLGSNGLIAFIVANRVDPLLIRVQVAGVISPLGSANARANVLKPAITL